MLNRFLLILLCFLAADANAQDDWLADLKAGQPGDIKKLIDRLAVCTHLSGEEAYDAERARELLSAMKDQRCDRLERDEAAARKRYARQPRVLKALEQAKDQITHP